MWCKLLVNAGAQEQTPPLGLDATHTGSKATQQEEEASLQVRRWPSARTKKDHPNHHRRDSGRRVGSGCVFYSR